MRNRDEVRKAIDRVLIPYVDCIAWLDFANGNPCYNPNFFASAAEEEEAAYTLAAVELELKNSTRHTTLSKKVAQQTGNQYVTYPWLRDTVTKILCSTSYDDLMAIAQLSRKVRTCMQAKGVTEIHSIADVLS